MNASRRQEIERVLNTESERWSSLSPEQLTIKLRESQDYQIKDGDQTYQFEVALLENTDTYVHVMVAVDDSRWPYAFFPMTSSFIRQKEAETARSSQT